MLKLLKQDGYQVYLAGLNIYNGCHTSTFAGVSVVKGVLVGFGIMVVLALIPIVHFIGIPFGPFIGGYFGISSMDGYTESRFKRALAFGGMLGAMIFVVAAIVGAAVMAITTANVLLVWGCFKRYALSNGSKTPSFSSRSCLR